MHTLVTFLHCSQIREILIGPAFIWRRMTAYSKSAPKTKKMQQMTQDCMAFSPSAFGELVVVVLNMFT